MICHHNGYNRLSQLSRRTNDGSSCSGHSRPAAHVRGMVPYWRLFILETVDQRDTSLSPGTVQNVDPILMAELAQRIIRQATGS
jgi:hypothetical protein